ncbi:uncharacterized protein LOC135309696 [Plodia interpunctella]|uniref:uncharacterized protein LOC135309696 n=1 Tax=Plodia interpunctella TaxID=58824 RepID=UPI003100D350
MNLLAEMEHFNVTYIYDGVFERFGSVNNNNEATELLGSVQNGTVDIAMGGFLLKLDRVQLFDFIWSYFTFTDDYLAFYSSRSENIPRWQIFYYVLQRETWIIFFVVIVSTVFLLIMLEKISSYLKHTLTSDITSTLIYMFGFICGQSGIHIQSRLKLKMCLLVWAWFAFFVTGYYQSELITLSTYTSKSIEVSDVKTLVRKNYSACIPSTMVWFMKNIEGEKPNFNSLKGLPRECEVTESAILYLTTNKGFYSVNSFYKYLYVINHTNKCKIHVLPHAPLQRVARVIYVNKGFPFIDKFNYQVLKLSESGLFIKSMRNLKIYQISDYIMKDDCVGRGTLAFKFQHLFPIFAIYGVGVCVATFVFIIELIKFYFK